MKRLIVTADDFGLTEKINLAIIEGHRKGIITSASLLANGLAFDAAVALTREAPQLGVGAHLNLTEGRPVSPASGVPSLVNEEGCFFGGPVTLARRIIGGKIRPAEIERELRAQIEKISSAGVSLTHVDGHKHIHLLPALFEIVVRLAREYRIRGVRCTPERTGVPISLWRRHRESARALLRQFLWARVMALDSIFLRRKLSRAHLSFPQHFYGITQTGFLDADSLREIICQLPDGTSELMCHPGYVDSALRQTPTRLLAQRELELQVLTQSEIKQLIADRGIQLTNYRNLCEVL